MSAILASIDIDRPSEQDYFQRMFGNLALQKHLRAHFDSIKKRNPHFSLRAFAKKIGARPEHLSEILNNRRNVSLKVATRLLQKIKLPPEQVKSVSSLFSFDPHQAQERQELEPKQHQVIAEWYHFGILSLAQTQNFIESPEWIASRLGISASQASDAIERLKEMGFLIRDSAGKLQPSPQPLKTQDDIPNEILRNSQKTNLKLAEKAIDLCSVNERHFRALTLPADPVRLAEVKVMINAFMDQVSAYLDDGEKTEVYKLCIQYFPVTQKEKP